MTSFRSRRDVSTADASRRATRSPRRTKPIDEQALYEYALGVLGRGMRTEAELRRLLQRKLAPATLRAQTDVGGPDEDGEFSAVQQVLPPSEEPDSSQRAAQADAMILAVLSRLRSHQYLSDARYAATYASLRREGRRLGAHRVAHDLRRKGVPAEIITREVATAYEGTPEEAQARAFLARKRVTIPKPCSDRDKARILRMLARAGFGSTVAWKILRDGNAAPDEHVED